MDSIINLTWVHTRYDYTESMLRDFIQEFHLTECTCPVIQDIPKRRHRRQFDSIYIEDGKRLVHMYTHDGWYTAINNILLEGRQKYYPMVDCMTAYLKFYSKAQEEVYRGVRVPIQEDEYILDRFTSFTTDINVARQFGPTIITVKRPPIACPIADISFFPSESEVLLPPCTRLSRQQGEDTTFIVTRRRSIKRHPEGFQCCLCTCCYTVCICVPLCSGLGGLLLGLASHLCACCIFANHVCFNYPMQHSNEAINDCLYCEFSINTQAQYIERSHSLEEAKRTCCYLCVPGYAPAVGFYLGFCCFCPGSPMYDVTDVKNPSGLSRDEKSTLIEIAPVTSLGLGRRSRTDDGVVVWGCLG